MALAKENRLTSKKDFSLVLKGGYSLKGQFLLVKYKKGISTTSRFGFAISLRVVGNVSARNRIKRILSEYIRQNLNKSSDGLDIVIIVNSRTEEVNFIRDLKFLLNKLYN